MKRLMAFSAVVMLVFGSLWFSPRSCCGDFEGPPPPDGTVSAF